MAGAAVVAFLAECRISKSQEEVLASFGGGWERSGLYSLDETPSQNCMHSSPPPGVARSAHAEDGASESSESVDGEGDMALTQEPVEWMSPPSSQQVIGAVKEESFDAAFESGRSQSPSQELSPEHPHSQAHLSNLGVSAEFLTQPVAGVLDFQFAASEDVKHHILRRETIPGVEFPGSSSQLATIPENIEACVVAIESSFQFFTQPAPETQPPQPLALASSHEFQLVLQESASQVQLAGERDENVPDEEIPGALEPEPVQQGNGYEDASALDDGKGCAGEQMLEESEVDGLRDDSQLPVDDGSDPRSTQQGHVITNGVPCVEVQRGDATQMEVGTLSDSDQREQIQRSNGDTKPLKRVNCAEELHGRQKLRRIEVAPVRVRSFPKTVMDVVRSRSRSLSSSLVDDECSILSIIMRAGVSFPPFVHEKRSV